MTTEFIPIVRRPFFHVSDVEMIFHNALRLVKNQNSVGEHFFSADEIMQYAATALQETFMHFAQNHLEEMIVSPIS